MKQIITNAAQVAVLRLIDETFKTGGGPISIGATVIEASKGPVGAVTPVTWSTWKQVFGKPLQNGVGTKMEGLRHLADAAKECNYVNVVRVVASDAKYPYLEVAKITDKDNWVADVAYALNDVVTITDQSRLICITAHTSSAPEPTGADTNWAVYTTPVAKDAEAYGTDLMLGTGLMMQLWPVDGDPSTYRKFEITDVDDATKRFTIKFYDTDESGNEYLMEYYTVGIDPNDRDDMGRTAFIQTVLEERSDIFRCNWDTSLAWADIADTLAEFSAKIAFEGGTNGGDPTTEDYTDAWDLYRNESVDAYLMFAAGNYDTDVLSNCAAIAELRRVMFFFDVPPYQDSDAALTWMQSTGINSRFAAACYCLWAASDIWYGGKTVWGASGAVVAACAKGDANMSGATPGIHYSPAGVERAKLDRTNVQMTFPNDPITTVKRDSFYTARINPVIAAQQGGGIVVDDALTTWSKENYSRFIWVNRIANYIDYRFLQMAGDLQHEPDGVTERGLHRGMRQILDELVVSGALVKPRDTSYGEETAYAFTVGQPTDENPYVYAIEQPEIDMWLVTWSFCPTGSARRIVGQPILIK